MNNGWPNQRFNDARRSTAATTAASKPMPVWKQKKRPLTCPSPIGCDLAGIDPGSEQVDGGDGIVGQADRAGEHVRRTAGQHPEGSVGAGDASRHLIERAVATEGDDDVDVAPGGVGGKAGRVAAPVGLDQLDRMVAGEAPLHDDGIARRHGRGERVDDEQDAQAPQGYGRRATCHVVPSLLGGNNCRP